ncbi:MAG: hypothetical protein FJX76_02320 [Armatimonadetes bacterium]|nr:hypothetical protein [Armatimonadota bacterium]
MKVRSFKKQRVGVRLMQAAADKSRYRDVHLFFGGTGAVGGTALLQMLDMYEEMMAAHPPANPDDVPILAATARTREEMEFFTRRLFQHTAARHGDEKLPRKLYNGYLTHSGIFIDLVRFELSVLPALDEIVSQGGDECRDRLIAFLQAYGAPDDPAAFEKALQAPSPFTTFLQGYLQQPFLAERGRFRSVVLGIPLPSFAAYYLDHIEKACEILGGFSGHQVHVLKSRFLESIRDDVVAVQRDMADTVLVAHTTGVGGMYDEIHEPDGAVKIHTRLGFAHAAKDEHLVEKQRFASTLTELYASGGIKTLITAAAIGIDEVRVRGTVPLHRDIARKLAQQRGEQPGTSRPARHGISAYKPLDAPLKEPPSIPHRFRAGQPLKLSFFLRSGENGFFTVSNADALYRVMRVASISEVGMVLATTALLGDDPHVPWFTDSICYYTETDYSRHVMDFLNQPMLLRVQQNGLEPKALQDLGSAKHQAELHTLGLLILLHRLRTLDVHAIDPHVGVDAFDARWFFEEKSRVLTFEDVMAWHWNELVHDLQILASANDAVDLLPLLPPRRRLFAEQEKALRKILNEVLNAVWAVTSLGSPILYERVDPDTGERVDYVRTGNFVAPFDILVSGTDTLDAHLRGLYEKYKATNEGPHASFDVYRAYQICVGGFVDLRPHAIVTTARTDHENLLSSVWRVTSEDGLRQRLRKIEPYTFFSTSGLLAVMFRLRALYAQLREASLELGTLQDFRWHMPRDVNGHMLFVPGVIEAMRLVSENFEKSSGLERLDGIWGYEERTPPERWNHVAFRHPEDAISVPVS